MLYVEICRLTAQKNIAISTTNLIILLQTNYSFPNKRTEEMREQTNLQAAQLIILFLKF
uniref:Uncharacterized protein n=1 Tax=Arundo donax TaxID=35708 RepID=A0A0A9FLL0_ARUDO